MANNTEKKAKKTNIVNKKEQSSKTKVTKKIVPKTVKIEQIPTPIKKEIKQEKDSNTFLIVIGIIVLVIVAIIIFRLTYAFFTATIKEVGGKDEDVTINTANLLVRYQDDGNILKQKIVPGDIISKDFEVISDETTTDTGYYSIVLENLKNTFSIICPTTEDPNNGEIVFHLYKYNLDENGNKTGNTSLWSTGTLPCSKSEMTSPFILYEQDSVLKKETNYYKLEIEYKNLSIDQTDNMDEGELSAKINIVEVEDEKRTYGNEYLD